MAGENVHIALYIAALRFWNDDRNAAAGHCIKLQRLIEITRTFIYDGKCWDLINVIEND